MRLIFVHGAGAWGGIWRKQLDYFKDAEAITLPGHPKGELSTSVEEYADWVHEYIKSRRCKDVVLAGHSLGGAIVMLCALKYPEDLRAIILIATGARLRVQPMYLSQLEDAAKGNLDGGVKRMRERYSNLTLEEQEVLIKKYLEIGPLAELNDFLCCHKFDIMDRVRGIRAPTLVICGDEDNMTPVKFTNYLAEKIPGAKKVIIEGATHHLFLEKPEEFNQAVAEFIKGLG